ncbi:hypothetical protein COLU111180_05975 [Cohnella lubricantis]
MTIRQASFRQVLERGGRRYAEVEVETDRRSEPRLLAYFRREGNGHYQLVRVIAEEQAEPEAGSGVLYAAAGEDLAAQIFSGPSHGGEDDRAQFGRRIVEFGDIREQLDHHL